MDRESSEEGRSVELSVQKWKRKGPATLKHCVHEGAGPMHRAREPREEGRSVNGAAQPCLALCENDPHAHGVKQEREDTAQQENETERESTVKVN